jgi:hypothetical protein
MQRRTNLFESGGIAGCQRVEPASDLAELRWDGGA